MRYTKIKHAHIIGVKEGDAVILKHHTGIKQRYNITMHMGELSLEDCDIFNLIAVKDYHDPYNAPLIYDSYEIVLKETIDRLEQEHLKRLRKAQIEIKIYQAEQDKITR